jgi:diadenosine tetraphosphate (Ap4A) HIT family hydrolase
MQAEYNRLISAGGLEGGYALCAAASVKEYEQWRIINNRFPYDRVATVSHMIVPKRHTTESGLTPDEQAEFTRIKDEYLHQEYDFFIEAAHHKKTIPAHLHIHLIVSKE